MRLHGLFRYTQSCGNLLVGQALRHGLQDIVFPGGQWCIGGIGRGVEPIPGVKVDRNLTLMGLPNGSQQALGTSGFVEVRRRARRQSGPTTTGIVI